MIEWNVSPEIFNIAGIAPRWYGLAFVIGFFFGEKYVGSRLIQRGFTKQHVSWLFTYMLVGTILGARLGHCLFYEPGYYLSNPLEILFVWKGGLASHGGFLGVILGVILCNKRIIKAGGKQLDYLLLLDLCTAPTVITGCYIRLGNLMNSEILGRPTNSDWGFIFKRVDNIARHPSQLYEAIGYGIAGLILFYTYKKFSDVWPLGRQLGLGLFLGFTHRFFVEFTKENQVAFENGMFLNMGQLLSIPMVLLAITLMVKPDLFKFLKKN